MRPFLSIVATCIIGALIVAVLVYCAASDNNCARTGGVLVKGINDVPVCVKR